MTHTAADLQTATLVTTSPEATRAAGLALAAAIRPGQVIALRGNLGAGKTTFVQGLAAGLGVRAGVTSPTFILINEYRTPQGTRLIHIDTYRLGDGDAATLLEAESLGLEEILDTPDAVVAVEWAERIAPLLPPDHLLVALSGTEAANTRTIAIHAHGPASAAALAALLRRDATLYTIATPPA
jgi:tRNA threonylcarbamoyladenosine biosynthesis protein TsaE